MPVMAAAGIAAVGSYIGGQQANKGNRSTAREQMEFQREMSNTAHQRQVEDLRAAGLNPILSARYGGASSPGGAMAQIKDTITPAINSGLTTMQGGAQFEKTQQETKKLLNETEQAWLDAWRTQETNPLKVVTAKWEAITAELTMEQNKVLLAKMQEDVKAAIRQGKITGSEAGQWLAWIKEIFQAVGLSAPSTSYRIGK